MSNELEFFELPRKDWYDKNGRIYKDVLIENFNAIENKLIELSKLNVFEAKSPNIDEIDFQDVTLDSPDNKIVNLRSFLNMCGLIGYPIECTFSGTMATRVAYWTRDYQYKILENQETSASSSKPYIYLNYVDNTVTASASTTTPANSTFIACYDSGIVKCVNCKDMIGINALYYLANMSNEMYDYTFTKYTRDTYDPEDGVGKNGRVIGAGDTHKKTKTVNHVTFRDIGRTSS